MIFLENFHLPKILKFLIIPGVFFIAGCENDIEKINTLTNTSALPEVFGKNVEVLYSDSGKVKMQLNAAEIKQFAKAEKPYVEFPKGIHVIFYDDSLVIKSEIIADYAKYFQNEKLWEARGNVVAHNIEEGEKLNTEELFWDEGLNRIYSNSFSRLESKDFIYYGQKGFETNQKFSPLKLKGSNGSVNIKDEKKSPANP
jgi:LPS export ABC transporter protein LptC